MKRTYQRWIQVSFAPAAAAMLVLVTGCGSSEHSLGTYDPPGLPDAEIPLSTGGAGGAVPSDAAGGSPGTGGSAGRGEAEVARGTGGVPSTGGAYGAGGMGHTGGFSGSSDAGGLGGAVPDAAVDAPAVDAPTDGGACPGTNPAEVTCLSSKDQCVPSACTCQKDGLWTCTADCRASLPTCDGGVATDLGSTLDGSTACSVTNAVLNVVSTSGLDSYCLTACGLPLRLFKDGAEVSLYDYTHPSCDSCLQSATPQCNQSGFPMTTQGYSYPLSQRFDVAGKCGSADCTTATCLEAGRYTLTYYVYSNSNQLNSVCGGTPIELSTTFDYPKTTEVKVRFSTATSCNLNSDCSTGQVCFHGTSTSQCVPSSSVCTSREPNFNRCMCTGCTCSGTDSPDSFWGCVT
jgi:hypothetical protein